MKKFIEFITGLGFYGLVLLVYAGLSWIFIKGYVDNALAWFLIGGFVFKNAQAIKEHLQNIDF